MRQAEAFFRADFPAAIVHGKAAVEAARQAGDLACWASMLGLLYVAEAGLGEDPDGALAHAEEAVAVARQSPATSALLNPLMMLSGALLRIDPDRAVATADECIRLDRTYRKAWSTICVAYAATVRLEAGESSPDSSSGATSSASSTGPARSSTSRCSSPTWPSRWPPSIREAALELTAIAGVIGSYFVFDGLAGYPATHADGRGARATTSSKPPASALGDQELRRVDAVRLRLHRQPHRSIDRRALQRDRTSPAAI